VAVKTFDLDENENPQQVRFFESRNDINGYTGGYGNDITAALCIRAITIAANYENARCMVGRATRPKLEDSTKKELMLWLPKDWVAKWPSERHNDIVLKHSGSTIEFRHIRQEGKGKGEEQSNLLSATYDYVGVDQFDDPEFGYKDFEDLTGRLRGTARYIGDDPTMPRFGPQIFDFTANPTRNWLFRELVNPYFIYQNAGFITQKLLIDTVTRKPIISIFNAPTRANRRNTGAKYERRMNIVFRGSMKKRFVDGDWDAYEGLVYPDYSETVHVIEHKALQAFIAAKILAGELGILEGYDYGQAVPSCYLLGFVDSDGNVYVVDGFYEPRKVVRDQAKLIKEIRAKWKIDSTEAIFADPDIFKSKHASSNNVGVPISTMFQDEGIMMQRGANSIKAGIEKVSSYLQVDKLHRNPVTLNYGAPRVFFSSELEFLQNEISDYYWNKNTTGDNVDKPRDTNDHSMDALKYMFTRQAVVIGMIKPSLARKLNPALFQFNEMPDGNENEIAPRHRYG